MSGHKAGRPSGCRRGDKAEVSILILINGVLAEYGLAILILGLTRADELIARRHSYQADNLADVLPPDPFNAVEPAVGGVIFE